eukprot:8286977-Karenia_brevis.AAC.1
MMVTMMTTTMMALVVTAPGVQRLRRCGWAWIINRANSYYVRAPVAYYGEQGSLHGRQTVPRAELTAVMRALLAVENTGHGLRHVAIWSDSKTVVDGYTRKGKATLHSPLGADWEDLWDRADALTARGFDVVMGKVKAHETDTNVVYDEQQAGNWLADQFGQIAAKYQPPEAE